MEQSLKLCLSMISLGRDNGSKYSLLDLAILLTVHKHPGCSQLDVEEALWGTREIYNGSIYRPLLRLIDSGLLIKKSKPGAARKKGQGATALSLSKKGLALIQTGTA